jgi:uncharacterized membrane protein YphA (DoxX/SURF4 family)
MIEILFSGLGWTDIALTLNRVAVGMFFMFSGYHKLFNTERHRQFAGELRTLRVHAVRINLTESEGRSRFYLRII